MQGADVPPPLPMRKTRSERDDEETCGHSYILINTEERAFEDLNDTSPPLPKRGAAIEQQDLVGNLQNLRVDMALASSAEGPTSNNTMLVQSPGSVDEPLSTSRSIQEKPAWKKGLEEARHLTGGLIARPYESTKHFSILRHSHGLVWYQGPTTNVAITVFSDQHLPSDGTIWLQKKGWLGKTGWAARAMLGVKGDWVNVTPENVGSADTISPTDERAWQRDIKNFLKKAPNELRQHVPRETRCEDS